MMILNLVILSMVQLHLLLAMTSHHPKENTDSTKRQLNQEPLLHPTLSRHIQSYHSYPLNHTDDLNALKEFAIDIAKLDERQKNKVPIAHYCDLRTIGQGWGTHVMCAYHLNFTSLQDVCYFFSFGISTDYSFDKELGEQYHCKGYALDPTVDYPVQLTPNVLFLKAGAHSSGMDPKWSSFSVPALRKWIGKDLFIVKLDCEGCEYSLADDIIKDDLHFFEHIVQLNIELHYPRSFMKSDHDAYSMGRLYRLLKLSHFELLQVDQGRCGPNDQKLGCHPFLEASGIPCDPGCRSFHFAKPFDYKGRRIHSSGHLVK